MAKYRYNVLTHGLSGTLDIVAFSQRAGGLTVLGKRRKKRSIDNPFTANQIAVHEKFQQASQYAKSVKANNPTLFAAYTAIAGTGQSGFNMAFADFFNSPSITNIDVSAYTGAPGSIIKARVVDDIESKKVHVRIESASAVLIEEGDAVKDADGLDWLYTATQTNASVTGSKVTVTATDNPGNTTSMDKTL